MIVNLINKQRAVFIDRMFFKVKLQNLIEYKYFISIAKKNLPLPLDISNLEVSVIFVSDKKIKELNRTYRNKDYVTDVLSFAYIEKFQSSLYTNNFPIQLGDIVISATQAMRQSYDQGVDFKDEILRLIIHGLLHLLGYDHEKSPKESVQMKRIEKKLYIKIN